MRLDRFDRFVCRLVLDAPRCDAASGVAPAAITPEGYLEADAALARDGLLQYSDGSRQWFERRTRDFLVVFSRALAMPVTDDHPPKMLDASTWAEHARGVTITPLEVTEPDEGGVSYLRTRLRIADAGLIAKVKGGEAVEVSIGFTSEIVPLTDAADGAEAEQVDPLPNHLAIVKRGRSGGAVRVLLDAAESVRYDQSMLTGAPTDMIEIQGPTGPVQVPTWVAALLQELAELKAASAAPAVETAPAPAPAAIPAVEAAPAPPPPPPAEAEGEKEEDSAEEEKSKDAIAVLVRRRARLERLAALAQLPESVYSLDDAALARAYVRARTPAVDQARLDAADLPTLLGMVDIAETLAPPAPTKIGAAPWSVAAPRVDGAADVAADFLKAQGY